MTTSSPVLSKALAHLTCPLCLARCEGQPFLDLKNNQALQCPVCGRLYPIRQGIIDFFPDYEETIKPGLAQRFMENNAIVAVYEKYFRPAFTSLGSPITYAEEVQWLRSVSPGISVKNILDLASGTGKYARLLNQTHDPELVFAVDISLPMLRKGLANARAEQAENIIHIRADAGALPFRQNSLHRVNCFGALHLFPEVDRTLSEIARITTTGALFTCLTSRRIKHLLSPQPLFSRLFAFHFFDEFQLEKNLQELGFTDMEKLCRKMVLMFTCRRQT